MMVHNKLSIKDVLKESIKKIYDHLGVCITGSFIGALLYAIIVALLAWLNWHLIEYVIENNATPYTIFWDIVVPNLRQFALTIFFCWIAFLWIGFGLFRFFLRVHDSGSLASFKELFLPWRTAGTVIVASCLVLFIVMGGLLLLVIPGIYWGLRFSQFYFFIIDKNVSVIDSLKLSWQTTDGYSWRLFWLYLIIGAIINILDNVFFLLFLITMPFRFMTHAVIYRKLTQQNIIVEEQL